MSDNFKRAHIRSKSKGKPSIFMGARKPFISGGMHRPVYAINAGGNERLTEEQIEELSKFCKKIGTQLGHWFHEQPEGQSE